MSEPMYDEGYKAHQITKDIEFKSKKDRVKVEDALAAVLAERRAHFEGELSRERLVTTQQQDRIRALLFACCTCGCAEAPGHPNSHKDDCFWKQSGHALNNSGGVDTEPSNG